jgi:hypothetical protein
MIIHNPILTGSLSLNGVNLSTNNLVTTGSNTFVGNQVVSGSLTVTGSITTPGTLTAQTLVVQTITSSVSTITGSTQFGSILGNTHVFTGSLLTTGSNLFSGYSVFSSSVNEVARFKSTYSNGVYFTFESGSTVIGDVGNSSEVFTGASTLDFGINARGNRKLQLGSFQTITLTITGSNVGVGVTTPARPFHVHIGATSYSTPVGVSSTATVLGTNLASYAELQLIGNTAYGAGILLGDTTNGQSGSILQFGGTAGEGGRMRFTAGGIETMNLRGGNVGIGINTPSTILHLLDTSANDTTLTIGQAGEVPTIKAGGANTDLRIEAVGSGGYIELRTNGTPRMFVTGTGRITLRNSSNTTVNAMISSGFGYSVSSYPVLIIGQNASGPGNTSLAFNVDVSDNPSGAFSGAGAEYIWRNVGSFITPNSSNNGYNTLLSWNSSGVVTVTTSDYRAKEDLKSFDALPMVEAMKLYDFRWIELQERMHGVLAHELQDIVPYAVMGEKDGDRMQGVDYSKLVPIMLKAIQELKAEINELKNN